MSILTTEQISSRMLIGGELTGASGGETFESLNPANEEVIGLVPAGGKADIDRAVDAAEEAFPAWAALGIEERAKYLHRLNDALLARGEEILATEVADTGNTIRKMSQDVAAAVSLINYYAGVAPEMKGETIPSTPRNLHLTLREPYGVVGRIVPFNHPIRFAAAALAGPVIAGNSVVVKPPEQSSLSAGILADICAGIFPPGVVNIVSGAGAAAGDALVRHPKVRRLAFTGSVPTGLAILRAAAETKVKNVTLELGGKNPMIVFPDVDLDAVVNAAVAGMNFAWQGQSCGSTSRLLLHHSIHDKFLDAVLAKVAGIRLGTPSDYNSDMGPINSKAHYERVLRYIEYGLADGARLAAGGKRPAGVAFERGYWVEPTVFADVKPDMRIAREEIFGPVLSVMAWHDLDEALSIANSTDYGLTAAIWTNDLKAAFQCARRIQSGYVWINGVSAHYQGTPFGGKKNSGLGREEGLEELLSYTETKTIHVML
ncbi:aldehyde dehydrogenase family protein [Pseudochelatococcus sp. B33]